MKVLNPLTFPLQQRQLIEASAGTGKTYTITSLYLRLLLGDESRPALSVDQILVLTFTVAATEELRQRIRDRVNHAKNYFCNGSHSEESSSDNKKDPIVEKLYEESINKAEDRKLLTNALLTMDEAAIFTIHGFCARVLSEQSFETGMLFNQQFDGDESALQLMAAEDCFRRYILTLPTSSQSIALSLWPKPDSLLSTIRPFLNRHNLDIKPVYKDNDDEFDRLLKEIGECKKIWLEDNVSQLVLDCEFKKNSITCTRLPEMQRHAQTDDIDIEKWQYWSKEALAKATKKSGTTQPSHPIFEKINNIWESKEVIKQHHYNLWHKVLDFIRENLELHSERVGTRTMGDLLSLLHRELNSDNPEENETLASTLRNKWPAALIDEFQDTDDLQYEIFNTIYRQADPLFFIGDPKQAIYQFRGADIFTYINAKRASTNEIYSLDTNWRSSLLMVNAVNHLFNKTNIFDNDEDIPFEAVKAAPPNLENDFSLFGEVQAPIQVFTCDRQDLNNDAIFRKSINHAAEQTSLLLNAAADGKALATKGTEKKVLEAGQIAFLVRSHTHAAIARNALTERGIKSVYKTKENVLQSDTADDLRLILSAILEPKKDRSTRAALATKLLSYSVSDLDGLQNNFDLQQDLARKFLSLHASWKDNGIAVTINLLIQYFRIGELWLSQAEGERQLTNLRHLGELLEHEAKQQKGMHRLLNWFCQDQDSSTDDQELRLESDRHLVQIVTIHASKGLEYDIVMLPIACFKAKVKSKTAPVLFHRTQDTPISSILDLGATPLHRDIAIQEELSEDMRLLYVAITRARYQCYLGLTLFKGSENTAFSRLLNIEGIKEYEDISEKIKSLPEDLFEVKEIENTPCTAYINTTEEQELIAPPSVPVPKGNWRLHSYTGLTRLIDTQDEQTKVADPEETEVNPGFSDDDKGHEINEFQERKPYTRFSFPRGPRVGVALHDMLEILDFKADDEQLTQAAIQLIKKVGLSNEQEEWLQATKDWIQDMLQSPLLESSQLSLSKLSLSKIDPQLRLNELEFNFPVKLDNRFLACLKKEGYLSEGASLSIPQLQGMMTGYIDLVVQHEGEFYLIDYKSNDLGGTFDAYNKDSLAEAISHHQYDLQYLIYCVALVRYLKLTMADFNYDTHFGGVCYLFLRGMSGKPSAGIHYDKPEEKLIEQLDSLLVATGDIK